MNESKEAWSHGPWRVAPYEIDDRHYTRIVEDTPPLSRIVVEMQRWFLSEELGCEEHVEFEANAHLIAAAPDLYAALKDARDRMMGSSPAMKALRDKTDAALRKAKGFTP